MGEFSPNIQAEIANGWCHYCGLSLRPSQRTRDHVIPKSRGGSDHPSNIVLACRRCNQEKDNMTEAEYRAWKVSPNRPKRSVRHAASATGQFAQRAVAALSLPA